MQVLLTGATGVIGRRLAAHLVARGDEVTVLTRDQDRASHIQGFEQVHFLEGDPTCPGPWQKAVDGMNAVVHLACAGLDVNALNRSGREDLGERRLDSTFQVAMAIEDARTRPGTFVLLSNRLAAGSGENEAPLAELIQAWEQQAFYVRELGVRVAALRLGFMLDPAGDSLAHVTAARPAEHPVGWIHVHDVVGCIDAALRANVDGVFETVAEESIPLGAMQGRLSGAPTRNPPHGEARALLEWPLPFEPFRSVNGLGYTFRFGNFAAAAENLVAAHPHPSPRNAHAVSSGAPAASEQRIVVLPCEGLLLIDGEIHHDASEAVARLQSAGLSVIPATSRGGKLPLVIADELGVGNPVIGADGSVVLDPVHREAIRTEALSADRITAIAMAVRTSDPQVEIVVERGIHVSAEPNLVLSAPLRALTSVDEPLERTALFARPATRLLLHAPPRRLERSIAVVRETWWREQIIAINEYAPDVVAITAPSADRGVALQRVESMVGVKRRTSIVIAATDKDVGLLEFAGLGFALPMLEARLAAAARSVLATTEPIEVAEAVIRAHLARAMRASTPRA